MINPHVKQRKYVNAMIGVALSACVLAACASPAPGDSGDSSADPSPTVTVEGAQASLDQLRDAIDAGDVAAVEALALAGVDLEGDLGGGSTALHRAAARGEADVVTALVNAGANIEARTNSSRTPLMLAADTADAETVKALADAGGDLYAKNPGEWGQIAWHVAAKAGNVDTMTAFIDLGVDVDVLEDTESTALMYAAYWGHLDAVAMLIDLGAEVNLRDQGGQTALYWAESRGHAEVAAAIAASGGE